MRFLTLSLLFSFLLFPFYATADHLPEKLLAKGEPETTLASINLKTTKLTDVIRMYGLPTREEKTSRDPNWTGYIWELSHAKIELGFYNNEKIGIQLYDIYIEGNANGQIGSTGRGLKLGDDLNKLTHIYGSRYKLQTLNSDRSERREEFTGVSVAYKRVTIQWLSEEFTLSVGLNDKGKIIAMWLILPECYHGDCE